MAQLEDADSLTELRKSILSFETKACGTACGTACRSWHGLWRYKKFYLRQLLYLKNSIFDMYRYRGNYRRNARGNNAGTIEATRQICLLTLYCWRKKTLILLH